MSIDKFSRIKKAALKFSIQCSFHSIQIFRLRGITFLSYYILSVNKSQQMFSKFSICTCFHCTYRNNFLQWYSSNVCPLCRNKQTESQAGKLCWRITAPIEFPCTSPIFSKWNRLAEQPIHFRASKQAEA